MEPSKVYFTDFHATPHETLLQKLHFGEMNHPDAEWETCLIHAEKIGIGTRSYQLISI